MYIYILRYDDDFFHDSLDSSSELDPSEFILIINIKLTKFLFCLAIFLFNEARWLSKLKSPFFILSAISMEVIRFFFLVLENSSYLTSYLSILEIGKSA